MALQKKICKVPPKELPTYTFTPGLKFCKNHCAKKSVIEFDLAQRERVSECVLERERERERERKRERDSKLCKW